MAISAQFTVNLYHFFSSHDMISLQQFYMDLKVHSFGFLKRPYLLHSVQIAVTGGFFKKMSEISPFRIFHFLVVSLFFRHIPPAISWLPDIGA